RFEWSVLDWNEPAIRVYDAVGAEPQTEWIRYRLAGEGLKAFAEN
ncbi:MAG: GNAT family N-acetyltransferase, partial [Devosia sp.]